MLATIRLMCDLGIAQDLSVIAHFIAFFLDRLSEKKQHQQIPSKAIYKIKH